jgi:hypothetical protein
MNDETGLERRYRRLLAWYPAQHRLGACVGHRFQVLVDQV